MLVRSSISARSNESTRISPSRGNSMSSVTKAAVAMAAAKPLARIQLRGRPAMPWVEIPPERGAHGGLRRDGQEIEPQVCGTDRVGLLHDQVPASLEPADGAGEGEGDQQSQQTEHGAVERADLP